jgi:hypothetical protein
VDKDEALKLGLQLIATAEYLATDAEICGKDAKEERALIQRSKIAFEEALAQPEQESDDLTIAYMAGFYDGKNKNAPQPKPEQEPEPVQVSPLDFVTMTLEKEHLVGRPIIWAQWPNEEKNT